MSLRYVPLASLLGGLLFTGCVIYTEPQDGPPPPPPPPPAARPAQPAPPAQPGKVGSLGPPNAPPPAPTGGGVGAIKHSNFTRALVVGEILVVVNGGNCDISIDDHAYGVSNQHRMKVGAGEHTVGCKPEAKLAQTKKVTVGKDELVTVAFDLNNPANTTSINKPANVAPPVGRPTSGQ